MHVQYHRDYFVSKMITQLFATHGHPQMTFFKGGSPLNTYFLLKYGIIKKMEYSGGIEEGLKFSNMVLDSNILTQIIEENHIKIPNA